MKTMYNNFYSSGLLWSKTECTARRLFTDWNVGLVGIWLKTLLPRIGSWNLVWVFQESKDICVFWFEDLQATACGRHAVTEPVAKVQLLCTFFSIILAFGLRLANCKWQQWTMISLYDVNRTTQAGSGSPTQLLCAVHFHLDGGSWRNAGNNYPKVHGRVSESGFFV